MEEREETVRYIYIYTCNI